MPHLNFLTALRDHAIVFLLRLTQHVLASIGSSTTVTSCMNAPAIECALMLIQNQGAIAILLKTNLVSRFWVGVRQSNFLVLNLRCVICYLHNLL